MKREIKAGHVDYTVLVYIPDPASTDGSGKTGLVAANLTVSYTRVETDNDVTVTDVTSSLNNLAALTTAHTDWGLLEVSNTLAPGLYRLDLADAVFAAGAWSAVVYVMITTSAAAVSPMEFVLVAHDVNDGVRLGLTALPNAAANAAGGLPISAAGGLALDTKLANTDQVTVARMGALTDLIDGGRLDLILDARASQTSVDDLPTNAELATALGTADDAILAAVAALNNLSAAGVRTAIGLATANLDTQLDALPTAAELATALGTADDAMLAQVALVKAKTDGLPTDPADQSLIIAATDAIVAAIAALNNITAASVWAAGTRTLTAGTNIALAKGTGVTGFNDLSAAQVNAEADTAIVDAALATAANLATLSAFVDTEVAAIKVVTDALGAASAALLKLSAGTIVTGTVNDAVTTPTTTVFAASDITEATADHFNGRVIIFTSGALVKQATEITDYALVSGEGKFTCTALTEAPVDGDTFVII